ncbi:MAG: class D sortase [Thermoanaerobaculia bacterium]
MKGDTVPGFDAMPAGGRGEAGPRHWRWLELALLGAGLALLAVYLAARLDSAIGKRLAVRRFERVRAAAEQRLAEPSAWRDLGLPRGQVAGGVDTRLWSAQRVRAHQESLLRDPGAPLALLLIPRIHLEVPILDGTDDWTLNRAVGRIEGTARPGEPGNVGIAGHRDGFFRGLKDVGVGDAIEIETVQHRDRYYVTAVRIVSPEDVGVLDPTPAPAVTLVTCFPFYFVGSAPQRYVVRAALSEAAAGRAVKGE